MQHCPLACVRMPRARSRFWNELLTFENVLAILYLYYFWSCKLGLMEVGNRFLCDGHFGVIRYVGEVPPTEGNSLWWQRDGVKGHFNSHHSNRHKVLLEWYFCPDRSVARGGMGWTRAWEAQWRPWRSAVLHLQRKGQWFIYQTKEGGPRDNIHPCSWRGKYDHSNILQLPNIKGT